MTENITRGMINLNMLIEVINQLKREKSAKIPNKLKNRIDTFFEAASTIKKQTRSSVVRGAQYYEYLGDPMKINITVNDRNSEAGKLTFESVKSVIRYGNSVAKDLTALK